MTSGLGPEQVERISLADLEIEVFRHRASRNGIRLDLTPKEFLLLWLLVRKGGYLVSREEIAEVILDSEPEAGHNWTKVIDVHIRRLRSKLDDPFEKKLIHTVRGSGYFFEDR